MKRICAIILVTVILCSIIYPASATNEIDSGPRFTYISSAYGSLTIDGDNIATCYAYCSAYNKNLSVRITGALQRYTNNSWNTIASWSKTGIGIALMNKQYYVSGGYSYRFIVNVSVLNSSGVVLEQHSFVCTP